MSEVLKVKPWGKDQGEYVLINADEFDSSVHQLFDDKPAEKADARKPGRPTK